MSTPQPLVIPPGFEQLSKAEQIDYVQKLWDLISATPDEVPVPAWHLQIVQERIASKDAAQRNPWNDVKQRLQSKYGEQ